MIHDRVRVYDADVVTRLAGLGFQGILTPSVRQEPNAIGGRAHPTRRVPILPLSARHLRSVLAEFVSYLRVVRSLQQESLDHILP